MIVTQEHLDLFPKPQGQDEMVQEFYEAMGGPQDVELQAMLVMEEFEELLDATLIFSAEESPEALAQLLKESCDLNYTLTGFRHIARLEDYDLLEDIMPIMASMMGMMMKIFPVSVRKEAFARVHRANMSKLGDDGKPSRRPDGKIMKGPNYRPADLLDLAEATEVHNQGVLDDAS